MCHSLPKSFRKKIKGSTLECIRAEPAFRADGGRYLLKAYPKVARRFSERETLVAKAIKAIDGKRLEYRESVENPPYLPKPTGQMDARS